MMASTDATPSYKDVVSSLSPPRTPTPLIDSASPRAHHPEMSAKIAALELHPTLETILHTMNSDLHSAHFLVRHMQSPPCYEGMALHGLLHRIEGDIDNARCWYFDIMGSDVFEHIWGAGSPLRGPGDAPSTSNDDTATDKGADANAPTENSKMSDYASGVKQYSSKPEEARAKLPASVTSFLDRIHSLRLHILKASAHPLPPGTSRSDEEADLTTISATELSLLREFCEKKFGTQKWVDARSEFVGVGEGDPRGEISEVKAAMITGGEGFRVF